MNDDRIGGNWKPVGAFSRATGFAGQRSVPRTTADDATGKATKPGVQSLFHRGRHRWLGLVARDRDLHGAAMRVAILIWEHLNAERGCAWPSLPYIGEKLDLHRATVIRSISALEKHGWLSVERKAGRHRGNRYRISFGRAAEN